jgi:prepilin-type N-terminal cleavage/methylation domain-containing protein
MLKTNTNQKGFTIVELLIVIVIIGILAALVLNTFAGIQAKGRDTDRQNDIKAVQGQLEAYYAQSGKYPKLADLSTNSWVQTNMKGIDLNALVAPQQTANSFTAADSTGKDVYGYRAVVDATATPLADCTAADSTDCQGYILTWTHESGDKSKVTVKSLN